MLSKHEILNFMSTSGPVTYQDIADQFGENYNTVLKTVRRMKERSEIHLVGKIVDTSKLSLYRGPHNKAWKITQRGLEKLNWYDENQCPAVYCSCKESLED